MIKKRKKPEEDSKDILKNVVKLGDYISYTPVSTSYTIRKEDTGRSQEFIINPSELNLWRVIRINEDGTVEVVSEYISSQKLYFYGEVGYNNYIGTLNKIAKQYETEGFTVGSRHMGYDPTKASEYVTNNQQIDEGYKTDAELVQKAVGTLMARIEKYTTTYAFYSIASRGLGTSRYLIDSEGKQTYSDSNKVDYGGARPILVFSAKLKVSGEGTKSAPYTLKP